MGFTANACIEMERWVGEHIPPRNVPAYRTPGVVPASSMEKPIMPRMETAMLQRPRWWVLSAM